MDETIAPVFAALSDLHARFEALPPAPLDRGTVEMLVVRPDRGLRETPDYVEVRADAGVIGDSWFARAGKRADGTPNPETQVTVMSATALRCLAERERWPLAGDQFIVDLDIGEANLPPGTRLAIGSAILEVSATPHTGCSKFRERYGPDAVEWVNGPDRRSQRLRGLLARVVVDGVVRVGDPIEVIRRD